jgi:hypothetical protein
MEQEQDYLNLLSIFYYVVAGIVALISCFPIIHLTIGLSFLFGDFFAPMPPGEAPPVGFGLLFTLIPLVIIGLGWAYAIALVLGGVFMRRRRHYTFCLVMAGLSCLFMPFGTVLGVLSIILLVKPEVKAMFEGASTAGEGAA